MLALEKVCQLWKKVRQLCKKYVSFGKKCVSFVKSMFALQDKKMYVNILAVNLYQLFKTQNEVKCEVLLQDNQERWEYLNDSNTLYAK